MRHLVNDDVLETCSVLLGKFGVEQKVCRLTITRPPFRSHPSDTPTKDPNTHDRLPLRYEITNCLSQLLAQPPVKNLATALRAHPLGHHQLESTAVQLDPPGTW